MSEVQAIQASQEKAPAAPAAGSPQALVQYAIEQQAGVEQLQKLMELQERWEANEARKAFNAAMAAFKADPPRIVKNRNVSFQTSKGKTEYSHATLDHITEAVSRAMAPHGLRFSWQTEQTDSGVVRVTCTITHEAGHSESVTLSGAPDQSGQKNSIQQIGSTVTYLQRYTLLAATGLAAEEQDDDGHGASGHPAQAVTHEQASELRDLLDQAGATEEDEQKFLRWVGASSLEQVPAARYQKARNALMQKIKQKEG